MTQADVPLVDASLQNFKWLGVSVNGKEYVAQQGSLVEAPGVWRHTGNGNPANMLEVVRTLLPQYHVVMLVERDFNRNVVVYCVEESAPGVARNMTAFWLMIPNAANTTDLGDVYTEDLTTMESTLAYGLTNTVMHGNSVTTHIKAVSKQPITVEHDGTAWRAHFTLNNKRVVLEKFLILTEPGKWTLWPKTQELHIHTKFQGRSMVYHFEVP